MAGKLTCKNIEVTQDSSVLTPAVNGPDTAWNNDISGIRYRKLATGMVIVEFTSTLAPLAAISTLPVGYRPATELRIPVASTGSGSVLVQIITAGYITNLHSGTTVSQNAVFMFPSSGM